MGKIFGIGVDAVTIGRMRSQRLTLHIIQRLFHPEEVAQANEMQDPKRSEFLASRFAAKEALAKALGVGFSKVVPSEVCVRCDTDGKPVLHVCGSTAKIPMVDQLSIHLSLTHENPLAIAFVVLEHIEGAL